MSKRKDESSKIDETKDRDDREKEDLQDYSRNGLKMLRKSKDKKSKKANKKAMKKKFKKGMKKGFNEGLIAGEYKKAKEVAQILVLREFECGLIAKITGLTEEEVEELRINCFKEV